MIQQIPVDDGSVLARYADWHGRIKGRPVAALGPESTQASLFAADEVLIDGEDEALARELVERHGAELLDEGPLPPPPATLQEEMLARGREVDPDAAPRILRLRFPAPPHIADRSSLLARASDQAYGDEPVTVTSEVGAAVAALATQHALEGRSIGLNLFGATLAMPLAAAQEGAVPVVGNAPFAWPAFAGRTRIVDAWQLVDSERQMRGDRLITVGVLDNGFWLDSRGVPMVSAQQKESDFGSRFIQLNLQDETKAAGGPNPNGLMWHGNATASAATARVGNQVGAAGSGGTVATPVFFQTDISVGQILRCVQICAAWGIDVLNMSIGIWGTAEINFPTSLWEKTFQFAFDNDVIMVAAAGNQSVNLPEDDMHIRPATRTPGVLTVGALDAVDNAAGRSNFGSSVWLWAPGTSVPVAPDGTSSLGSLVSGTSFASPIVAGVAAMMRYVNPHLTAADARRMLVDSGWQGGDGRVSKGLDALAAVLRVAEGRLTDPHEPNESLATARDLFQVRSDGTLGPGSGGFTTLSRNNDADFWKFKVERFSNVTLSLAWYQRLASLSVDIIADDPHATGPGQMSRTGDAQSGSIVVAGLLAPGSYRVNVNGAGVTGYQLLVSRQLAPLPIDIFEKNDSFERAARLIFDPAPGMIHAIRRTFGPGSFEATLHQERGASELGGHSLVMNDDFFRLDIPGGAALRRPNVSVYDADAPLEVTLFNGAHEPIKPGATCIR